jgi:hypothetical protein
VTEDIRLTVGVEKARVLAASVQTPIVNLVVQDRRACALSARSVSTIAVEVVEVL